MIGEKPKRDSELISFYNDERELLSNFFVWFKQIDPDIIIGWHVIGFDLLFLDNKCRELGISLDIARAKWKSFYTTAKTKRTLYFCYRQSCN